MYSVGNDTLDNQHQKIINTINNLIEYQSYSVSSEEVTQTFNDAMKYIGEHLEYEETLLEELNYPDIQQQKNEHLEFQKTIGKLILEASNQIASHTQNNTVSAKLLSYLSDWFGNHILTEDMKYKPFLEEKLNN